MSSTEPQFLDAGTGAGVRRIACISQPGASPDAPGLMWLPGLKSDMASTKATALAAWSAARGLGFTRFDYSGHGQSSGVFEDGTISRWCGDACAVFEQTTSGPQILIGSSMGGYIALLLLRAYMREASPNADRIKALVLIAPAWDMTETLMWAQFPADAKRAIMEDGFYDRPSEYGAPYRLTRALIEDGRRHLIGASAFDPGRPIYILHGLLDPDVPWEHTLDLAAHLAGDWVHVDAIPDGEHRLSRPEDLERLYRSIEAALADVAT
jgi:pimeloyl-ACP methyl ester carboxylesterase